MVLEFEKLADKESPDMQKVLSASFEYLLSGIAIEHSKLFDLKTVREFNASNRLTQEVLLSYPFFVALANGNSQSLYSLLGEFYTTKAYGPFSITAYALLQGQQDFSRAFKYFTIPALSELGNLQVKSSDQSFETIIRQQRDEILDINGSQVSFKELKVFSDKKINGESMTDTSLYMAIESSIKIIQNQSGGTFFDGDFRTIRHQSSYFEVLSREFENIDEIRDLPYGGVGKPNLRPFYSDDLAFSA